MHAGRGGEGPFKQLGPRPFFSSSGSCLGCQPNRNGIYMKALFDMTVWDASQYQVGPHGRKEEQVMNYYLLIVLHSESQGRMLLSLNCVYFRASTHAMIWIGNFARVRTDDRERNFRDSHVPQPVLQKNARVQSCRTPRKFWQSSVLFFTVIARIREIVH